MNSINRPKRYSRIAKIIMSVGTVFSAFVLPAFAGDNATIPESVDAQGFAEALSNAFSSLYNTIGIVVSALALVAIGVLVIKILFSHDEKKIPSYKVSLFLVIGALALYWLAPVLIAVIKSIAQEAKVAAMSGSGAFVMFGA